MAGGRPKGALNKSTKDVRQAALKHAPAALKRLSQLMTDATSEQAQVAACKEILDRAYGKSTQPLDGELRLGISDALKQFVGGNAGRSRAFLGFDEEDQHQEEAANGRALHDH
jgi:hypothetical protein